MLSNKICQQKVEQSPITKDFFLSLPKSTRKQFAENVNLDNSCKIVIPSQTHLGIKGGVRRETANRKSREFERLGLYKTQRRDWRDVLQYHLNPIFHDRQFRLDLATIPEFKVCFGAPTIWWLLPAKKMFIRKQKTFQSEYVTPINTQGILIINQSHQNPISRADHHRLQMEKILAQLTPEQKRGLDRLRRDYRTPVMMD